VNARKGSNERRKKKLEDDATEEDKM